MRIGLAALLLVAVAAPLNTPLRAQFRGPRGEEEEAVRHGWLFSLEEGKAEARKSGKPLMVVIRCVP
jgi:hypothetical protein